MSVVWLHRQFERSGYLLRTSHVVLFATKRTRRAECQVVASRTADRVLPKFDNHALQVTSTNRQMEKWKADFVDLYTVSKSDTDIHETNCEEKV